MVVASCDCCASCCVSGGARLGREVADDPAFELAVSRDATPRDLRKKRTAPISICTLQILETHSSYASASMT